ncbi:MlaD family protein [Chitinilyticum litopenaei]|uniref:MlaD family protein n=1 Tax=Chitinilyticum litopenaei TaxID=1121276 RepID=UPI00040752B5|nr:MlaD family protein [Chitinilyticum litopenaei]
MEQATHFKLGLFVLAALLALGALMIIIGGNTLGRDAVMLESYFDESVQGLDVGSKVRFRGVVIGEVTELGFSYEVYQQQLPPQDRRQYVRILAKVNNPIFANTPAAKSRLATEIGRGLRIRITPQGLTGTSYLEVDYLDAAANPPLAKDWTPEYSYVPSARSTVQQLVGRTQDILGRIQKLPLEETVDNLNTVLKTLNNKLDQMPLERMTQRADRILAEVEKVPVARIASDSSAAMQDLRLASGHLQTLLADPALQAAPADLAAASRRARELLDKPELDSAIQRLDSTMGRLDRLLAGREDELGTTLDNLHAISGQLKQLSEQLNRYPGSLLANPPPPYQPPR